MEGVQFQAASAASNSQGHQQAVDPRTEFNTAYANLEHTIRNFSKEKIQYEQTIQGLDEQVAVLQESIQKVAAENQDVLAENARLIKLHEENEKNQFNFDTLCSTVERKQEIIADSVQGFEKFERDVFNRYEEHEEFLYCLKFRQVQLKRWIDGNLAKNRALEQSLEQKEKECEELTADVSNAKLYIDQCTEQFQRTTSTLEGEKAELKKKMDADILRFGEEKNALFKQLNDLRDEMNLKTSVFEEEKMLLEKKIEEDDQKIHQMNDALIHEKETLEKLQLDMEQLNSSMAEEKLEFETRYAVLQQELEQTKVTAAGKVTELEEQISRIWQEKESLEKESSEKISNLENQNSTFGVQLGETSKKLQEVSLELEAEKLSKAAVQKELEEFQLKRSEELTSFETEKSSLSGELDELQKKLDQQSANFKEETAAMKVTFQDEYAKFEKEKKELEKTHQETVDNLKEEIDREKNERRTYQKKYLDQKLAISKMVEEVGVRPVILPSGKDAKRRPPVPVVSTSTPDRAEAKASQERQPPKTPMVSRPPPPEAMTMTPTRAGILKRHSFSAGDKNQRNVSFGPTFIADFVINSDTDESTASSEIQEKEKKGDKEAPVGKRMKFSDGRKPESSSMQNEKKDKERVDPDYKPEKPVRRYIRKISQPKASDF